MLKKKMNRYFLFTPKRILSFVFIVFAILALQWYLTGSMISKQEMTTQAGNSASAVIGILDKQEIIRQKFRFDRKVVLKKFELSFGSFKENEVGEKLHVQIVDGDNVCVYETEVPVSEITPNSTYLFKLEQPITIPKKTTCTICLSCSSKNRPFAIIPTVNTTNRTAPNLYMSTLSQRTKKKSLTVSYTYYYRQLYPLILLIIEFILLFVLCFEKKITQMSHRNPKIHRIARRMIVVINPFIIFLLLELLNNTFTKMYPNIWIFTWMLLGAIQFFLYTFTGNANIATLIMDAVLFPIGLVNFFLMNVRGTPLLPVDIVSIKTAMEVAESYEFNTTPAQFVVFPTFFLWCLLLIRVKKPKIEYTRKRNIIRRFVPLVVSLGIVSSFYYSPILSVCGIKDSVWNKVASCQNNGFYLNFFLNLHYLRVSQPSGYSHEEVKQILAETEKETQQQSNSSVLQATSKYPQVETDYLTNKDFTTNQTIEGQKPNIILIMNESLADFSLVGDITYNQDPLAFMHSLKENTIYGHDFVSIFGAGTSNSEFEAMTGNTMTFFPSGCNVYQQFMHESTFSMPSYLKTLGYQTLAIHPSSGANWNRVAAYESMKFDKFLTIDDFVNPEYVRYISDKESYKKIIEKYEEKEKGTPLFVFDMTIQNHGGYLTNTDWKEPISVEGSYLSQTEEFLSATKVSDDAFSYLVSYFEKQEEPTIICMFGDHQPSIEVEFFEKLLEKPQDEWELDEIQKRYDTPFIIWANYDIQEGQDVHISNNYLENMILKQAGLPLPLYNQFIEKVSQSIPAMNVNGFMDTKGNWHKYTTQDMGDIKDLIQDYKILQYGYYSDSDKKKMAKLFKMEP